MPMVRTVKCDCCPEAFTEIEYGSGFPGWLNIKGVILDGNPEIWICPIHLPVVMDCIDELKHGKIKLVEA